MKEIKSTHIDDQFLDSLLGIETSKIGFYAEVKQKIQELEAANLSLRGKKTELQAVFDAIGDSVIIYDRAGLVQYRNHLAPRVFPQETMHGQTCRALFHPDRAEDHESCPVGRALRGESCQISFSTTKHSGKNRYFDVIATPIAEPTEGFRALVFIRDVTERRARELQLLQAEKMSSIGVLAAGVAHEINNPMTSVAGYAEALQRRFREAPELAEDLRLRDFPRYLEIIVREVYRCKGIIDSLLSFSRKSDGAFGKVDLNGIIGEVLELVRHQGRDKNIEIDDNLLVPLPPGARRRQRPAPGFPESDHEWVAGHRGQRFGADRNRPGERSSGGQGDRYRQRHRGGHARPDLESLLHHQGGRQGSGARPGCDLRHHQET